MERLTKKSIGCFEYALKEHESVPGEFGTYEAFFDYSMAVKKLGEYEDAEEAKAAKPMTNGDRIRAMSDEELTEFLWCFDSDEFAQEELREGIWILTKRKLVEWIKQPVGESNDTE